MVFKEKPLIPITEDRMSAKNRSRVVVLAAALGCLVSVAGLMALTYEVHGLGINVGLLVRF